MSRAGTASLEETFTAVRVAFDRACARSLATLESDEATPGDFAEVLQAHAQLSEKLDEHYSSIEYEADAYEELRNELEKWEQTQ